VVIGAGACVTKSIECNLFSYKPSRPPNITCNMLNLKRLALKTAGDRLILS